MQQEPPARWSTPRRSSSRPAASPVSCGSRGRSTGAVRAVREAIQNQPNLAEIIAELSRQAAPWAQPSLCAPASRSGNAHSRSNSAAADATSRAQSRSQSEKGRQPSTPHHHYQFISTHTPQQYVSQQQYYVQAVQPEQQTQSQYQFIYQQQTQQQHHSYQEQPMLQAGLQPHYYVHQQQHTVHAVAEPQHHYKYVNVECQQQTPQQELSHNQQQPVAAAQHYVQQPQQQALFSPQMQPVHRQPYQQQPVQAYLDAANFVFYPSMQQTPTFQQQPPEESKFNVVVETVQQHKNSGRAAGSVNRATSAPMASRHISSPGSGAHLASTFVGAANATPLSVQAIQKLMPHTKEASSTSPQLPMHKVAAASNDQASNLYLQQFTGDEASPTCYQRPQCSTPTPPHPSMGCIYQQTDAVRASMKPLTAEQVQQLQQLQLPSPSPRASREIMEDASASIRISPKPEQRSLSAERLRTWAASNGGTQDGNQREEFHSPKGFADVAVEEARASLQPKLGSPTWMRARALAASLLDEAPRRSSSEPPHASRVFPLRRSRQRKEAEQQTALVLSLRAELLVRTVMNAWCNLVHASRKIKSKHSNPGVAEVNQLRRADRWRSRFLQRESFTSWRCLVSRRSRERDNLVQGRSSKNVYEKHLRSVAALVFHTEASRRLVLVFAALHAWSSCLFPSSKLDATRTRKAQSPAIVCQTLSHATLKVPMPPPVLSQSWCLTSYDKFAPSSDFIKTSGSPGLITLELPPKDHLLQLVFTAWGKEAYSASLDICKNRLAHEGAVRLEMQLRRDIDQDRFARQCRRHRLLRVAFGSWLQVLLSTTITMRQLWHCQNVQLERLIEDRFRQTQIRRVLTEWRLATQDCRYTRWIEFHFSSHRSKSSKALSTQSAEVSPPNLSLSPQSRLLSDLDSVFMTSDVEDSEFASAFQFETFDARNLSQADRLKSNLVCQPSSVTSRNSSHCAPSSGIESSLSYSTDSSLL